MPMATSTIILHQLVIVSFVNLKGLNDDYPDLNAITNPYDLYMLVEIKHTFKKFLRFPLGI